MAAVLLQHIRLTSWLSWPLLRVKSLKKELLLELWCLFCCAKEEFLLKSTWNPFSSELWLQVDFCLVFRLQFQREKGFSFFHVCCFARVRPTYSSREWTFLTRHPVTYFRVQGCCRVHSFSAEMSWFWNAPVRKLTPWFGFWQAGPLGLAALLEKVNTRMEDDCFFLWPLCIVLFHTWFQTLVVYTHLHLEMQNWGAGL